MKTVQTRRNTQELLPIRSLQVFVAVIDSGSMTEAARRLNLTQSGVSMAVADLEQTLNRTLLDRALRPLRPTASGRLLHARAMKVLAELDDLRAAVETSGSRVLASLHIGLIASVTAAGAPAIRELQTLARELRVSSGLTPELSSALKSRLIDVLVTSDPLDDGDDTEQHLVVREPFVIVRPKSASRGDAADLHELATQLPMVHYTARSRLGASIDTFLRRQGVRLPRLLEFDSSAAVLPMVSAGLGWALTTPLCIIESRISPGELSVSPIRPHRFVREIHAVCISGELSDIAAKVGAIFSQQVQRRIVETFEVSHPWILEEVEFPFRPSDSEE